MVERGEGAAARAVRRRRVVQGSVSLIVLVTLAFGWWFPWLGFSVPVVMIAGIIGSLTRGRYVCGNLCPRGGLYDRWIAPLSRRRAIPQVLRAMPLRWMLFGVLMGFMVYRISLNPLDPLHWGRVFWMMCLVTTAIGVPLALVFHPRTWCSFCPMGTVQHAIGGGKRQLTISDEICRACGMCEAACPMGLSIVPHRSTGSLPHRDCVRCSECIAVCPTGALAWPRERGS